MDKSASFRLVGFLPYLTAALTILVVSLSLGSEAVIEKDFVQPYLMGRAIRAGVNPWLPLPELARGIGFDGYGRNLPHPTPHPPFLAFFGWLFSWLPLRAALALWLVIEMICLTIALGRLFRLAQLEVTRDEMIWIAAVVTAWNPMLEELAEGQFHLLLLLLFTLCLEKLRDDHQSASGLLLGLTIAIKTIGWPVMVWLALTRRFRALAVTVAILLAINLLAVAVIGREQVSGYYDEVARQTVARYRLAIGNYSLWSIGWRAGLACKEGVPEKVSLTLSILAVSLVGVVSWHWIRKAQTVFQQFSLLIILSLLLTPIIWTQSYVLLLVPAACLARGEKTGFAIRHWLKEKRSRGWCAALSIVFLMFPTDVYAYFLKAISPWREGNPPAMLVGQLFALIPAVIFLFLMKTIASPPGPVNATSVPAGDRAWVGNLWYLVSVFSLPMLIARMAADSLPWCLVILLPALLFWRHWHQQRVREIRSAPC